MEIQFILGEEAEEDPFLKDQPRILRRGLSESERETEKIVLSQALTVSEFAHRAISLTQRSQILESHANRVLFRRALLALWRSLGRYGTL